MSLPKWMHDAFGRSFECSDGERLEEALTIALEALEQIIGDDTEPLTDEGRKAKEAIKRINALGGTEE